MNDKVNSLRNHICRTMGSVLMTYAFATAAIGCSGDDDDAPEFNEQGQDLAISSEVTADQELVPGKLEDKSSDINPVAEDRGPLNGEVDAFGDCPANAMCTWDREDGNGQRFNLFTEDSTFHNNPCFGCEGRGGNDWGDKMTSFRNNKAEAYCYYSEINFVGARRRIEPRQQGTFGPGQNNEFSSARRCSDG